ncbi:MAG: ABC transporter ATP-binding protein [Chromatocurvus sp.]
MPEPVLQCIGLGKQFTDGNRVIRVLQGVELTLNQGESLAIVGASGSGKSTLLNLLGGLDVPSEGQVLVAGRDVAAMRERERCLWRNQRLGFVYQFHHLLPEFTAVENVAMPLIIGGQRRKEALRSAADMLERVGLDHRLSHRPGALSGGERQRVAIARGLVTTPDCVLMDEPTGNLDPAASQQILSLIDSLGRDSAAFIVVTHDPGIAARMHRTLELRDAGLYPPLHARI